MANLDHSTSECNIWRLLQPVCVIPHEVSTTSNSLLIAIRIRQTTWLSTEHDTAQDPYTLLSFLRAHNYLATAQQLSQISDSGLRILSPDSVNETKQIPPPVRLWFPRIPLFSSPRMPSLDDLHNLHPPPRQRSYNGTPDPAKAFVLRTKFSSLYTF